MEQLGVYKDGDDVTLRFSLDVMSATSASYSVKDASGNIVTSGVDVPVSDGQMFVTVTVPGAINALGERERDLRRVTLSVDAGGAFITKEQQYIVLRSFELSVPKQSFISIGEAQLQAIDMLNGGSLLTGGEGDLRRQLIEATKRIKSMSFSIRRIYDMDWDDYDRPQNMLQTSTLPFRWAGQYTSDIVDWDKLTDDDFMEFPEAFRNALALAVVNEASEIAGGSDIQRAREDGIVSESIGETTMAYRQGKGAVSIVAKTTWRMLLKYMDNRVIVRRQ
ncbi:TPA: hypothetical protein L9R61_004301 [Klebsiella pneumoniae]|uniref:hypothetical protein n=1 Tax=Klebsiella TaxID=570 RepID=UPI000205C032|nr:MULTISPECIES: hypothetical protein [Klebsiella]MBL9885486.1 hypothetical protein [Klebsiella pneumoniae]EGF62963.1 hypothetical protein HMPREF9538_02597 [Klebsiella sp. MS 92-3]HBR3143345.1 hypothetical protein [Klebsiella pneumoniae]HBR4557993.1 hypothetical protein [Klebsiella pneumoniae]HBV6664530.1 hypothetical protein [Klebsiella pneumoniae]